MSFPTPLSFCLTLLLLLTVEEAQARPPHHGAEMLEKLSDQTGGLHFHVRTSAQAKEAVIKIGQALGHEYVIGYHPDSCQIERD